MGNQIATGASHRALTSSLLLALCLLFAPAVRATGEDGRLEGMGFTIQVNESGVVVTRSDADGPAHRAGLREGDRILLIDGVDPSGATLEQVVARLAMQRPDPLSLKVRRRSGGSQLLRLKRQAPAASVHESLKAATAPALSSQNAAPVPGPQSAGRPEVIQRAHVSIGDDLVDFTLPRLGGGEVTLSDFSGKPILVDFWATWCGPCRAEAPGLAAIHARFGDRIQIIGVSLDYAPGEAIRYTQDHGLTYPQAITQGWEDPVVQSYGVHRTGIPFNVVYGPDGRIAAMDLHGEPLALALELLLRQE